MRNDDHQSPSTPIIQSLMQKHIRHEQSQEKEMENGVTGTEGGI